MDVQRSSTRGKERMGGWIGPPGKGITFGRSPRMKAEADSPTVGCNARSPFHAAQEYNTFSSVAAGTE